MYKTNFYANRLLLPELVTYVETVRNSSFVEFFAFLPINCNSVSSDSLEIGPELTMDYCLNNPCDL